VIFLLSGFVFFFLVDRFILPPQTPTLYSEILRFKTLYEDAPKLVVAYSGGLDSTVLLHLLTQYFERPFSITAIYIDHQLQVDSNKWSEACEAICLDWKVPFKSIKVDVERRSRHGIESQARRARYQALHCELNVNDILLTAHHQRDQSETFLLNLQRGSGVAGLAAMPYQKPIKLLSGQLAKHVRPLLSVPYQELLDYARHNQLNWVEDPSNQDLHFSRNQVRHQLLPEFEQACSNIQQQIQRSASHQSEALQLLNRLAKQDLNEGCYSALYIDLETYKELDWISLKNVLKYWAYLYFELRLGHEQLEWIRIYSRQKPSASACLKLREGELRFYRTKLYYVADKFKDYSFFLDDVESAPEQVNPVPTQVGFKLVLPGSWYDVNKASLVIRNLRKTDKVNANRLKKWFQQQGIPVWQRTHWPVLCLDDHPIVLWGAERIFTSDLALQYQSSLEGAFKGNESLCFYLTELEVVTLSRN